MKLTKEQKLAYHLAHGVAKEERPIKINGEETFYSVTENGVVFSNKHVRRVLTPSDKIGYLSVCLYLNGKRHEIMIHRLVANNFIDNPHNKQQVNHIDGNKSNNHFSNLEWVTQSENIKHAYDNGLMNRDYTNCGRSLLDENNVRDIRKLLADGVKAVDVSKVFKVSQGVISNIKLGKTYYGVGFEDGEFVEIVD
jgi:hypothetical protein